MRAKSSGAEAKKNVEWREEKSDEKVKGNCTGEVKIHTKWVSPQVWKTLTVIEGESRGR